MSLITLSAEEAIGRLHEFDAVIDARSEAEFEEDHLPGAVNWPTLNNAERHAARPRRGARAHPPERGSVKTCAG